MTRPSPACSGTSEHPVLPLQTQTPGGHGQANAAPAGLTIPVTSVEKSAIHDTFNEGRDGHRDEATDIPAPRGTPVVAAVSGTVKKLFHSEQGGLTVYEFDQPETYCSYYAHVDRYAEGLTEGMPLVAGQLIGYVGTTGNAPPNTPHLHFAIFKLGPEKQWWRGTAIDPYPVLMASRRLLAVLVGSAIPDQILLKSRGAVSTPRPGLTSARGSG